jgi:hypothetical protein
VHDAQAPSASYIPKEIGYLTKSMERASLSTSQVSSIGDIVSSQVSIKAGNEVNNVCSTSESWQEAKVSDYILVIAAEMYNAMQSHDDVDHFNTIVPELDWILEAFSLRIRNEGTEEWYLAISYLAHYYRRQVHPYIWVSLLLTEHGVQKHY